ncbi:MAG TPA: SDR family oxidoreductase [Acidimicrobiales bacterium]
MNCIGPGNMDTPMSQLAFSRPGGEKGRDSVLSLQAMRRLGEAWEVAEMVAFLASDAASFCTGAWSVSTAAIPPAERVSLTEETAPVANHSSSR